MLKRKPVSILLLLSMLLSVMTVNSPSAVGISNSNYVLNTLTATPLVRLPVGSIKPKGWLLNQLMIQKNGLGGNAEPTQPWLSAHIWRGGPGDASQKDSNGYYNGVYLGGAPYYIRGLANLAYTLDDADLKAKVKPWFDYILSSAGKNLEKYFGPIQDGDLVNRTYIVDGMIAWFEGTTSQSEKSTVLKFLEDYFKFMDTIPDGKMNVIEWSATRAYDIVQQCYWLSNRTSDSNLKNTILPHLIQRLMGMAYNWTDIHTHNKYMDFGDDFLPKHIVNLNEALKASAIKYVVTGNPEDRNAYAAGIKNLAIDNGRIDGVYSGTETLAGLSSTQGVETCAVVENIESSKSVMEILGEASIGDQLEKVAYNALPAALSKDMKGLAYYTLPNEVTIQDHWLKVNADHKDGLGIGTNPGALCCCFNFQMGWPKFVQSLWMATDTKGLAAVAYGPSEVNAKVANGVNVKFTEDTNYPFDEGITLTLSSSQPAAFPLKLRIPGWCSNAVVKVNGVVQNGVTSDTFYTIERTWSNGDVVTLNFPMSVRTSTWVNNSVGIERGPLVYSLKIGENWTARNSRTYPDWNVTPTTSWNYGLVVDRNNPEANINVVKDAMPYQPFSQGSTPVKLTAKAKKIPSWGMEWDKQVAFDPPQSPVSSNEAEEQVELVPYGAENLRITYFPQIGTTVNRSNFYDNFQSGYTDPWVNYGSSWYVKNGRYLSTSCKTMWGSGKTGIKSIAQAGSFLDFVYEADVACNKDDVYADAGLIFRINNPGIGSENFSGYAASISPNGGNLNLGKCNGPGTWKSLGTMNISIQANTLYHMKIEAVGNRIKVYLGDMNSPKIDVTDTSSPFLSGMIGVRQFSQTDSATLAGFDNVSVKSLVPGQTPDGVSAPGLTEARYEAENAVVSNSIVRSGNTASNGLYIGGIDFNNSYIQFDHITVPKDGEYRVTVRYANGLSDNATHAIIVNGQPVQAVTYKATGGWGKFGTVTLNLNLKAGINVIRLSKENGYAELDFMEITVPAANDNRYEAEDANVNHVLIKSGYGVSNNQYVGRIDYSDSYVEFRDVSIPKSGTYNVNIRYSNALGAGTHAVIVNGQKAIPVNYPSTGSWSNFSFAKISLSLNAGSNVIRFTKENGYAQLDYMEIDIPNTIATPTPKVTPKPTVTPTVSPTVTPTPTQTPVEPLLPALNVETSFNLQSLLPNQMITAKVSVKDITSVPYSGTKDVLLIVGLFDKYNTMVNVSYISKGIHYQGSETLSAGFKLPQDVSGCSVRAFVWDGTDIRTSDMIPLSNYQAIGYSPDPSVPVPAEPTPLPVPSPVAVSVQEGQSVKLNPMDYSESTGVYFGTTSNGEQIIGYTQNGDYIDYTLNVTSPGQYTVSYSAASAATTSWYNPTGAVEKVKLYIKPFGDKVWSFGMDLNNITQMPRTNTSQLSGVLTGGI